VYFSVPGEVVFDSDTPVEIDGNLYIWDDGNAYVNSVKIGSSFKRVNLRTFMQDVISKLGLSY
jgi:hypothetical protein